jgi:hypothetical protein
MTFGALPRPFAVRAGNSGNMRTAVIAILLGAAACALREVQGPPGKEQVVVQGVLRTEASEQVLWIERSIPAGDPISSELRPLDSPPTRIEVRDATGALFTYQPDPANTARFVTSFTPVSGRRYDLLVEAGTHVIRGSTVVPPPITIVDPAADTVIAPPANAGMRVSWASGSSLWAFVFVARGGAPNEVYYTDLVQRDTSHLVSGFYFSFHNDSTLIVSVLAVDSVTARVIDPFRAGNFFDSFDGNLTGGAGFFGASTADRIVVREP